MPIQSERGSIDAVIDGRMTSAETIAPMDSVLSKMLQPRIEALKVLVVEDDGTCGGDGVSFTGIYVRVKVLKPLGKL